jgi:hypothetical protein
MDAQTRQLSNEEMGRVIGLSPSGSSKLRNGKVGPSTHTTDALVEKLGGGDEMLYGRLNRAWSTRQNGDAKPWMALMEQLTTVPADFVLPNPVPEGFVVVPHHATIDS